MNTMEPSDPQSANLMTLSVYDVPLCVECPACSRRVLIEGRALMPHSHVGEMESLARVGRRLRCSCGHLGAKWKRPPNREAAVRWSEGWDVLW